MRKILLLNGPNLNTLGTREPAVYGSDTLDDLQDMVVRYGNAQGVMVTCYQSNSEGELIDRIHEAPGTYDGIVYNPGAHTHYSYALRDAVGAIELPVVEVHISDIDTREEWRRVSVIAPACAAQVKGLGFDGYCRAIDYLCENEAFERLGEGYEQRRQPGAPMIAGAGSLPDALPGAPVAAQPEPALEPAAQPESAPTPVAASEPPEDFAEPYAEDIAAIDAGLVSFERQARVREACERFGLDALMVRDTSNIRWITALDGVFDEERAHALLMTRDRSLLHTDSRYGNAIRTAAQRAGSDITVSEERISHVEFAHNFLCGPADYQGKLGIEDSITYAEFVKVAESFGTQCLSSTTDVVLKLRAVKDRGELSRLLAAQAVTDAAFQHIIGYMRPGMTEREVQLELEDFMVRHGGEGLAFSSIVATGANGADPHAIPGATRLEAGQCVVLDFGAKAFGYCSDMTRTVFLGQPDERLSHAWQVLRQANEAVEALLRPGVTGKEAHELAEQVLAEGGYAGKMGHGLGHGVGIDVHEQPALNSRNDNPLVAGNVVTVEPGIYLPGEFGMRLEDCGVVTMTGYDVFSQIGHDMVII